MREVLFKGKRKDNGEWIESRNLIKFTDNSVYMPIYKDGAAFKYDGNGNIVSLIASFVEIIPETVGQFTGLSDKDGRKIFEGDIFKFNDEVFESCYTSCGTEYNSWEVENYGVVGFDEDTARFDFVQYKYHENAIEADLHENHNIEFSEFVSNLEVIGNIYDNSDLLKEGEENA